MEKKKHKIITQKQLKNLDTILRSDEHTFYVPSESEVDELGQPKQYFVYKSLNIGWTCDCMNFTMNLKDLNDKSTFECKHIRAIKKKYEIE